MFDHLDEPTPFVPDEAFDAAVRRRGRSLRRRRRMVLGSSLALAVFVVGAVGAAALVDRRLDRIERVEIAGLSEPAVGEARTVLLVGTDAHHVGEAAENGPRADTVMVARIDPARDRTTVLSVPRDLVVEVDGQGSHRVAALLPLGGPSLLVDVLDASLGIEIDHYLELEPRAAAAIADVLGGIDVQIDLPMRDPSAGLDLPAGCLELDGEQVMALARARRVVVHDGIGWQLDPTSDLGRTARQRALASAVLQRVAAIDATDGIGAVRLLDRVVDHLTLDERTTPEDLLALARAIIGSEVVVVDLPVADRVDEGRMVLELADGAEAALGEVGTPPALPADLPPASSAPPLATVGSCSS